jgi:hypothetical protein
MYVRLVFNVWVMFSVARSNFICAVCICYRMVCLYRHVSLPFPAGTTRLFSAVLWTNFCYLSHSLQVRDRLLANGEEPIDERIPIQDVYGRTYCRYPET